MKTSNLAWRVEDDEPDTPAQTLAAPAPAELPPSERRLLHSRRLGLDYRAIVIRDDGLRPFRVH